MKILTVVGLTAGCCLAGFVSTHASADNENAISDITCRVALDGTPFSEIGESNPADRCCYVLQEVDWYNTHGVLPHHWYERRDDSHIYLTLQCRTNAVQSTEDVPAMPGASSADDGKAASSSAMALTPSGDDSSTGGDESGGASSAENHDHGHDRPSSMPSSSSENGSAKVGNPGNAKPVGGAGEAPNGDASAFKPDPGTKGKSN